MKRSWEHVLRLILKRGRVFKFPFSLTARDLKVEREVMDIQQSLGTAERFAFRILFCTLNASVLQSFV